MEFQAKLHDWWIRSSVWKNIAYDLTNDILG